MRRRTGPLHPFPDAPHDPDPRMNHALGLARNTAWRMWRHPEDLAIDLDDWLSEAYLAGVQAARSWRPDGGAGFASHVITRVRYDLLDFLDRMDWLSNGDRKKERERAARYEAAETSEERLLLERAPHLAYPASLDALLSEEEPEDGGDGVHLMPRSLAEQDNTVATDLRLDVEQALSGLPNRLRVLCRLVFWEEMRYTAIGREWNLSASRVGQLMCQALAELQLSFPHDYLGRLPPPKSEWATATRAEIDALVAAGESAARIGEWYGVHANRVRQFFMDCRNDPNLVHPIQREAAPCAQDRKAKQEALTALAREIRDQYDSGESLRALARRYGVSRTTIQRRLSECPSSRGEVGRISDTKKGTAPEGAAHTAR